MEANRGFLPWTLFWDVTGAILYKAKGQDYKLDRGDGK